MNSLPHHGHCRKTSSSNGAANITRRQSWRTFLALVAVSTLIGHLQLSVAAADTISSHGTILVSADGSVAVQNALASHSTHGSNTPVRLAFGLPRQAPARRWLEDDSLPICHTVWEKDGIRYTQTVLVTRLGTGDWPASGFSATGAVLMVQIVGENFTNEYREATAEFALDRAMKALNLELRDDLIFSNESSSGQFLAVINVPSSGVAGTNGLRLRFRGNMPPGNTGSMVVKLPFAPPAGEADIDRLRDLEFDNELQRVKRHWEKHGRKAAAPVRFSE